MDLVVGLVAGTSLLFFIGGGSGGFVLSIVAVTSLALGLLDDEMANGIKEVLSLAGVDLQVL